MSARKKSTRRNRGGRRNVTPPPYSGVPSVAELDQEMRVAELAMTVASQFRARWR